MDSEKHDCGDAKTLAGHARFQMLVSSGMHKDARLDALAFPVTIGSDLACDVVLGDDGVKPHHLRLYSERGIWFVAALEGAVHISGHGWLAAGRGMRIRLPLDIAIGQARLQWSMPCTPSTARTVNRPWSRPIRRYKRGLAIASIIVAIVVGPVVFAGFSPAPGRPSTPVALSEHVHDGIDDSAVEAFLRDALTTHDLAQLVLHKEQAAWMVSGDVDQTGYERWLAVRQTAETRYGPRLVIESKVNANGVKPPDIIVAAVRLGASPYMVDDSGKRYTPGMQISDGWVLSRLDDRALVFQHGSIEYKRDY